MAWRERLETGSTFVRKRLPVMDFKTRPLRVAMVASSLRLGGAEKQTFYMARSLHQAGIEVGLFYLGGGGYYETLLREIGVPIQQNYISDRPWLMLAKLILALCRWQPQLVFVTQFDDLRYGAVAGQCCHSLVLGGVRSDGLYELDGHPRVGRWLARLAHGLVANSFCASQNLASRGVRPEKIAVLPNVIDVQDFDERSRSRLELPLPSARTVIAAVGRLQPCKRFDRLLEAFAVARRSEPGLTLVVAGGDGGAHAALLARAKTLHLAPPDFLLLGEIHQVAALLTRATMLVLTSDYEGFPNVILEAMAARLPVITVPAGDAGVIVQHGRTGYVVSAEDIGGIAGFMVQLARTPAMCRCLGDAGRQRVEQEYHYRSLAARLLTIFHHFANQQRKLSLCELLEQGVPAGKPGALSGSFVLEPPTA